MGQMYSIFTNMIEVMDAQGRDASQLHARIRELETQLGTMAGLPDRLKELEFVIKEVRCLASFYQHI
jgi:hypothetical protein